MVRTTINNDLKTGILLNAMYPLLCGSLVRLKVVDCIYVGTLMTVTSIKSKILMDLNFFFNVINGTYVLSELIHF